jgi:alkanesulfonate monooxygenase SsuD/methylene tetrahydromethanopterin reductase-like flavin-dependent oxidoreductase (luciferase family)
VSELHLTRLCRTEPVAPALPCADLVGAASRRGYLGYVVGDHLFPNSELTDYVKCRCYIYMDETFTLQLARASGI